MANFEAQTVSVPKLAVQQLVMNNRGCRDEDVTLDIPSFDSNRDDFEEWIELFENAVSLAANAGEQDNLAPLYRKWLPLMLDSAARAALKQATSAEWNDLKEEMVELLVDPQEKAKWQAKQITIKWDGRESIHALASRVKRAVDKYERGMPEEFKEREYYQRFKNAFKKPMRKFIAYGCAEGDRTIETAKEVALRYHIANYEDDDDEVRDVDQNKGQSNAFASSTFHPDRITGIEDQLAAISIQLEKLVDHQKMQDWRLLNLERRMGDLEEEVYGRDRPQSGWDYAPNPGDYSQY